MVTYFNDLLKIHTERWYGATANGKPLAISDQARNSSALKALKSKMLKWFRTNAQSKSFQNHDAQRTLKQEILPFMEKHLGLEPWVCRQLDEVGYLDVTSAFITRVRQDFPDMDFNDIFQALRNVWVLISLQLYMDAEVVLTDAVFAYSMLYPLTDNYLDDPTISTKEKIQFNQRFHQKIKDDQATAANASEAVIFNMIDLIHNNYPRSLYPEVTLGLLAILDGQNKSLKQQNMTSLYALDLLEDTFYKGGTSVLADAYLVKGTLTENVSLFAYGYGIILQMADDLQDLADDQRHQHTTMMNAQAQHSCLDGLMDKYVAFIQTFFTDIYAEGSDKQKALKQLLEVSIELLLYHGVSEQKAAFSKKYYASYMKNSRFSRKSFYFQNNRLREMVKSSYTDITKS